MNQPNQEEILAKYQEFTQHLEELAKQGATAQVQIAIESAKQEFWLKYGHYLQEIMAVKLSETYSEIAQELQKSIQQFANFAANRTLEVESSTAQQIGEFKPGIPQFASFSETLSKQRNQQSNLLKLSDVQVNSDADKLALQSLGITSDFNNDLDAKDIEANFVTSINNDGHDRNGNCNGHE